MGKKEEKVPKAITIGMSQETHKWWKEVCEISNELGTHHTKAIHEALEVGMPTILEILRIRVEAKRKEDAIRKPKGGDTKKN